MTELPKLTLVWLVVLAIAATTAIAGASGGALTVDNAELSPTTVPTNETATVSANVTNPGDANVTETVELTANGSTIASQNLTVAAGETTSVSFTPSFDTPGQYELAVEGTVAGVLTVEPAPSPELAVTNATLAATDVLEDESVAVEATVTNTGDAEGTESLELTVDGTVVATTTVTVSAGESATAAFAPTFEDPGSYEIAVADVRAGSLTVADDPMLIENATTITEAGEYRLGEDITAPPDADAAIVIAASDVVLDGQNHVVDGTVGYDADKQSVHYGVAVSAANDTVRSNVTVRDVTVTEWTHGVDVDGATSVTLADVTAERNRVGVAFADSEHSTVRDGHIRDNAKHGVRIKRHSTAISVHGTTIADNGGRGLFVSTANGTVVQNVLATDNRIGVLVQDAVDTVVRESTVEGSAEEGIRLRSTNGTQLLDNQVSGGSVGIAITAGHGDGHDSGHDDSSHEDDEGDDCEGTNAPPGSTYVADNVVADVTGPGVSVVGSDGDTFVRNRVRNASSWAFHAEGDAVDLTVRELWMNGAVAVSFDGVDVAVTQTTAPDPLPGGTSGVDVALESTFTSANGTWDDVAVDYAQSTVDDAGVDESALYAWRYDADWSLVGSPSGWQYDDPNDAWIPVGVDGIRVDTTANRVSVETTEPGQYALLAGHPTPPSVSVDAAIAQASGDDEPPVTVHATVASDSTADVTVQVDLTANGPVVDSRTVTVGNETADVRFTPQFAPGVYDVGVSGVDAGTVTIDDVTAPVADAGPDRAVEVGETVVFDGGASIDDAGITDYRWTFDDGSTATGTSVSHAFDASGSYDVELTVEDAAGNADTAVATVRVAPDASTDSEPISIDSSSVPRAADVVVVDAALETTAVDTDESAVVSVTLANEGNADGEFEVELVADERVVDSVVVAVSAGETETATLTTAFDTAGEYDLAVSDQALETLVVRAPDTQTPVPVVTTDSDSTPAPDEPPADDSDPPTLDTDDTDPPMRNTGDSGLPTLDTDDETPAADPGTDGGFEPIGLALVGVVLAGVAALALHRWT